MRAASVRGTPVALYTGAEGNYFFHEIRDLLAAALSELGCRVELRDGIKGFSRTAAVHLIIAPHEFFYLGKGRKLRGRRFPPRTVLYSTEQMDSEWFPLAQGNFRKAAAVWEIDRETARYIRRQGVRCHAVPLGFAKSCKLFRLVRELPRHHGTAFLEPAVLRRPRWGEPLRDRPLDLFFAGNQTPRRERFFGRSAEAFGPFRGYFHFTDSVRPVRDGAARSLNSALSIGLVQRSKIVLNIHRLNARYFEWQRMVLQGIGQKALVISEPVSDCFPLKPGRDFIEAALADIPRVVSYYLSSPRGLREAQRIADAGFQTLKTEGRLADAIRPALVELLSGATVAAGRSGQAGEAAALEEIPRVEPVPNPVPGKIPKLSVAVALRGRDEHITACLESIRGQTLKRLDLILIEDGSRPAGRPVARWLAAHKKRFSSCRLIRPEGHGGLAGVRNAGFREARTPFVFVLDADNLILPRCLESLGDALKNSRAHFAYSYMRKFGEAGGLINAKEWQTPSFRSGFRVDAMALMRREAWESLGGYQSLGVCGWEDFDFLHRLSRAGGWGVLVPEILSSCRIHLDAPLEREAGPDAEWLQRFFAHAFQAQSRGGADSETRLACSTLGSHQLPGESAALPARKADKYKVSALSLLLERNGPRP